MSVIDKRGKSSTLGAIAGLLYHEAWDFLIVLILVVAVFAMPFDRHFTAHMMILAGILAFLLLIFRRWELPNESSPQRYSPIVFFLGSLVLLVAAELGWCYLYGAGKGASLALQATSRYLKMNAPFWLGCGLLTLFFSVCSQSFDKKKVYFLSGLCIVVLCAICYSCLHEYIITQQRVRLKLGYPVPAAFVFTVYCVFTIAIIEKWEAIWLRYVGITVVLVLSGIIISATGTRLAYIFFIFYVCCLFRKQLPFTCAFYSKKRKYSSLVIFFLAMVSLLYAWSDRLYLLYADVSGYVQGNPTGSVAARLVLWEAGVQVFWEHPLGSTSIERYDALQHIIQLRYNDTSYVHTIMSVASHHLHNTLIENFSLQGMWGGGIVAFCILCWGVIGFRARLFDSAFKYIFLFMLFYGCFNALFVNDKTVMCISQIMPLLVWLNVASMKKSSH